MKANKGGGRSELPPVAVQDVAAMARRFTDDKGNFIGTGALPASWRPGDAVPESGSPVMKFNPLTVASYREALHGTGNIFGRLLASASDEQLQRSVDVFNQRRLAEFQKQYPQQQTPQQAPQQPPPQQQPSKADTAALAEALKKQA